MAAAAAAVRAAEKEAERARLAPIVDKLANRRDLIEHAADTAQAIGIVGERKAIKAQLHRHVVARARRAACALPRRYRHIVGRQVAPDAHHGAALSAECIEVITTGSPKALVFMVDEDSRALAHKIIILHETAGFIAGSDTEDNPSATLVREI